MRHTASLADDAAQLREPQEAPVRARRERVRRQTKVDVLLDAPRRVSPLIAPLIPHAAARSVRERANTPTREAKRKLEARLWAKYLRRPCDATRNALWMHYQGLVRFIAERQKAKLPEYLELGDLISAGNMGLLEAIRRFDPSRNVRFETYCVPRIRGAIVDWIRAADWVPRLIRNRGQRLDRVVADLAIELGHEPTEAEIAAHLKLDVADLAQLKRDLEIKTQFTFEGDMRENDGNPELLRLEMMEARDVEPPVHGLQREEIRRIATLGLQYNERWVIEQYYFNGRSMKEIGDDLHLSESRICQIHAQAIQVLRRKFRAYNEDCAL